jgi:hypothetical protein
LLASESESVAGVDVVYREGMLLGVAFRTSLCETNRRPGLNDSLSIFLEAWPHHYTDVMGNACGLLVR